jgi:hypothetical protein
MYSGELATNNDAEYLGRRSPLTHRVLPTKEAERPNFQDMKKRRQVRAFWLVSVNIGNTEIRGLVLNHLQSVLNIDRGRTDRLCA